MKTEDILESLGFKNEWEDYKFPHDEFYDISQTKKICLKPDGIWAYSVGSHPGEDYLEMHLNFIPQDEIILSYLIEKVFCLA